MFSRLIRALLSSRSANSQSRRARRRGKRQALPIRLELLEDRRLMAVTAILASDDVAPFVGNVSNNGATNDNQLAFRIQSSDTNSVADVSLFSNNGAEVLVRTYENVPLDGAGIARLNTPVLADGNYFIRARSGTYAKYFFTCDLGLFNYEAERTLNLRVDTARPLPVITSPVSNATGLAAIPVTVTFSEPVQGFTGNDLAITNGTLNAPANLRSAAATSSTTYSFNITPSGQGPLGVQIAAGAAFDSAGNPNQPSAKFNAVLDNTAPVLKAIARDPNVQNPTSNDSLVYRIDFSELVNNVTANDFVVNGSTANITQIEPINRQVYRVTVSGGDLANANNSVSLALNAFHDITDLAGNALSKQAPVVNQSFTLDNTSPVLQSISRDTPFIDSTNANWLRFTIRFSEAVKQFDELDPTDFVVTGSTARITDIAQIGPSTYFLTIAGGDLDELNGDVGLNLSSKQNITDFAGNPLLTLEPPIDETFTLDNTLPIATVTTNVTSPTNLSSIPVTVSFSEPIRDFGAGDVAITNGNLSKFTVVNASTYTFDVVAVADGPVRVFVPYASARDFAGNFNPNSNQLRVVLDRVVPRTTLSTSATSLTNAALIPFEVSFSERVTGFEAKDVIHTNSNLLNFRQDQFNTYRFDLQPIADGPLSVNIPDSVASDVAGNGNLASTPLSLVSDRTRPGFTIRHSLTNPTNLATIPLRYVFTEPIFDFIPSDIVVGNGKLIDLKQLDSKTYDLSITPASDGLVSVTIPPGAVNDQAGNLNGPSTPFTVNSDRTAPTLALSTTAANPTNLTQIPVTVTLSEPLTNFVATDVFITNGKLSNFSKVSATNYNFNVTPILDGTVTISVPAGVESDAAGNKNLAASPLTLTSDRTVPTAVLSSKATNPTNLAQIPVTLTFSEDMTGVTASDVSLSTGTLSNFVAVDAKTYNFNVIPASDGAITVTLPAGRANDAAGNSNTSATPLSLNSDRTGPTAKLSSFTPSVTNTNGTGGISVNVTFSEPVVNFTASDLTTINATTSKIFAISSTNYLFTLLPTTDGAVSVQLPALSANDPAGNLNIASNKLSFTVDRVAPIPTLSTKLSSPTNASSIPITVTFDEPVTDFTLADVSFANATLSNLIAVNASTYTFDAAPISDGNVVLSIPFNGAFDAAGNGNNNTLASRLTIVSDRTAPIADITTTATNPTNLDQIPFTVTFNEGVTGFDVNDLGITNGTANSFVAVNGTTYTFNVAPTADGNVTINVPANHASDAAGNNNAASSPMTVRSDRTAPTVNITTTAGTATTVAPIPLTVTFSETVTDFALTDLAITNGTAGNLVAVNGSTYTLDITPTAVGNVIVNLGANAARDAANNGSLAASPLTVDYQSPLDGTMEYQGAGIGASTLGRVFIQFSQPVTGLDIADFVLQSPGQIINLPANALSGSGTNYLLSLNFLAAQSGQYTLTIVAAGSGISDSSGNQLGQDVFVQWLV